MNLQASLQILCSPVKEYPPAPKLAAAPRPQHPGRTPAHENQQRQKDSGFSTQHSAFSISTIHPFVLDQGRERSALFELTEALGDVDVELSGFALERMARRQCH